jgi:MFS family permease
MTRADAFDRRLIAPMILGAILNPINSSIIAVSLVPIGAAFGAPAAQTAWLVSGLYLATAIGQPVVGRLVDGFGPRRLFLIGSALVGIAGLIGALAPSLGVLIGARVLLGFGTCAGYPAAMALIKSEGERTGRDSPAAVLTGLSVSTSTIAVIGPTLGGLLIGLGGWRATLAINVPVAVVSLAVGWAALPRSLRGHPRARAFDLPGMALFATMLTALLFFLMDIQVGRLWLLALAAVAGAGFVAAERRVDAPFIDLRVLRGNPPLLATYARTLLTFTFSYCFLYGYTQWLEDGRGLSASKAGLVLMPLFITGIAVAAVTGRRAEVRGKLLVTAVVQLAGSVLLLTVHHTTAIWLLLALGILLGVPQGLGNLANQNALYFQAEPDRVASSAGLLRTFGYLGAISASSAAGAFFGRRATDSGMHHLALFMLGASLLLTLLTVADRSLGPQVLAAR